MARTCLRWRSFPAILLALLLAATAAPALGVTVAAPQFGVASWHRGTSHTASGRRWVPEEFVAAHRSLPLGTFVRVVNVTNGRQTVVQITDRGPYARGRIIDLSPAAARQIGCLNAGLARVRVEVLGRAVVAVAQSGTAGVADAAL